MLELQSPLKQPRVKFKVAGNLVWDTKLVGDDGKQFLVSVADRGHFYALMGKALGTAMQKGDLKPAHVVYDFQPRSMIRDRSATVLDTQIESSQVVVVDVNFWTGDAKARCPTCAGYNTTSRSWVHNAHSCKGHGAINTIYFVCQRYQCE